MQWLKGTNSRVLLQELCICGVSSGDDIYGLGGYLAVSSGTITDEMIQQYIDEQEGEQIADVVDSNRPPLKPSAF